MSIGTGLVDAGLVAHSLVPAFGDLGAFFENLGNLAEDWGGAFLIAMGTVAIVWAGWLAIQRLMSSNGQNSPGWGKILALLIVGGALAFGGFSIVSGFGNSGLATIEELSTGASLLFL